MIMTVPPMADATSMRHVGRGRQAATGSAPRRDRAPSRVAWAPRWLTLVEGLLPIHGSRTPEVEATRPRRGTSMRIGLVPGQVEALRAAFAEQRRQLTRRGLFVAAGSSVIAGACGYTAGRAHHDAVPESPALVDPVRALALGDLDELRRQAMHIDAA